MEWKSIQISIYEIQGQKITLDLGFDAFYEAEIRALSLALKRDKDLFPNGH